jgi:hypothetical protein
MHENVLKCHHMIIFYVHCLDVNKPPMVLYVVTCTNMLIMKL